MFVTASQQVALRGGFLVLIGFAILRPFSLMAYDVGAAGFNILEFMGIAVSYLLLIPFIMGLGQFQGNRIVFSSLLFCLYCAASVSWGSAVRNVAQVTLPFLLFFSARMFITQLNQMKALLTALVLAFLIPITVSTYNVSLGRSIEMVEWWNKLPRHAGAFSGSHTLAYAMLFYSFLYCILHRASPLKKALSKLGISFFLFLSVYCLYQSHTRTALIGFIVFWFVYLWGNNRKLFLVTIVLSILAGIIFQSHIKSLIWKTQECNIDRATSGRTVLWKNNIQLFLFDSNLPQQLLGRGLGHEHLYAFHSDYLALLMNLGIIGLFLYLLLLVFLLWDIFLCRDKKTRYLFGGILISTAIMNFGSNAVIFRIELSQYFWLIMGLFYWIRQTAQEG